MDINLSGLAYHIMPGRTAIDVPRSGRDADDYFDRFRGDWLPAWAPRLVARLGAVSLRLPALPRPVRTA